MEENDAYAEAQKADILRQQITQHADGAVKYGQADRDWVNSWLVRLGAKPITGKSEYRLNVAVTGVYGRRVTATSRTEAVKEFMRHVERVTAAGKINIASDRYDNVYQLKVSDTVEFYSGPEDVPAGEAEPLGLDALRNGIRDMLKEGVAERGWGYRYAQLTLGDMGLPLLPERQYKTVKVPVSGVAELTVVVFDGEDDAAVQRTVHALAGRAQLLTVKPDEIGQAAFTAVPAPAADGVDDPF